MLQNANVFFSFSVDDLAKAKAFYKETLGLSVSEEGDMGLKIEFLQGGSAFLYPKQDHVPASFTVMNFMVDDIEKAVTDLKKRGVQFETYSEGMITTDEQNIARGKAAGKGPDIAWFSDPAGNVLAVLEE